MVLEDEKVKRRLGDAVFTSRMYIFFIFLFFFWQPSFPLQTNRWQKKKFQHHPSKTPTEKAKVVDVLNDVLPRIKAFVESKVEDGLPPRPHSGPDGLYGLGGGGGEGAGSGELVAVNGHVHVGWCSELAGGRRGRGTKYITSHLFYMLYTYMFCR